MINAEWLFQNHKLHKAHIRYLNIALGQRSSGASPQANPPQEAAQQMAVRLYEYSGESREALENQRLLYLRYLQLYESVCTCMTEKEKWLIQHHYIDETSLAALTEMKSSPFYNCAKSTVWRHKTRLLEKADAFLNTVLS